MDVQLVLYGALGVGIYVAARVGARMLGARLERDQAATPAPEQDLILTVHLGAEAQGQVTPPDLVALEASLADALAATHAGQVVAHQVAFGQYQLVLRGPDADRLWAALAPLLRASARSEKAKVVKRIGRRETPISP